MRALILAAMLTGCGFAGAPGTSDEGPDDRSDESPDDEGAPVAISAYCADPRVVLCLEFDEVLTDGIILDGTVFDQKVIAEELQGFVREGGGSVAIDGDSLIEVAGNDSLDVREGFTVELWANLGIPLGNGPGGDEDNATLIAAEGQFELAILPDGNVRCAVGDKDAKAGPGTVVAGTWHHYACTWDGAAVALYIDGVLARRADHPGLRFEDEPGNLLIGAELDEGELDDAFTGVLDDLRLFSTALTAAEICPGGCW